MEKKVLKTSIPKNTLKEKYFWVEGLLIKQCFVQILKSVSRFLGGGGGGCGGVSFVRFVQLAEFSRVLFVAGLTV